ncbi:MAG: hypothetical protein KA821_18300, partial [Chitinophagaceae bacterium]|nr:hypothetical protein [Chitinophagaceae bacterium]
MKGFAAILLPFTFYLLPCLVRILFFTYLCTGKRSEEGNGDRSLLLFPALNMDGQIQVLEQKVAALIAADPDVFLVDIRIKPTNNIKVFLDADNGISIDRLI